MAGRPLSAGDVRLPVLHPVPEMLPERFTMEFDYSIPTGGEVWISFGDENKRVEFGGDGTSAVYNGAAKITADGRLPDGERGALHRARVMVDGKYVKTYLDDTRILNVPNADVGPRNKILFYTDGDAKQPTLFGNFRIAAGGKKLYDARRRDGPGGHAGDLLRHGQRPDPPRVLADAQGDRRDAEGASRPQAGDRGPHRQRRRGRREPGAEREAGGRRAPGAGRRLPGRRRLACRPRVWGRPSRPRRTTRRKAGRATGGSSWSRRSSRGREGEKASGRAEVCRSPLALRPGPQATVQSVLSHFVRALRLRCPHCGGGPIFTSWSRLLPVCPVCGLGLERGERGYWLGAYFFNLMATEAVFSVWVAGFLLVTWPNPPWGLFQITTIVLMVVFPFALLPVLQDAVPGVRSARAAARTPTNSTRRTSRPATSDATLRGTPRSPQRPTITGACSVSQPSGCATTSAAVMRRAAVRTTVESSGRVNRSR